MTRNLLWVLTLSSAVIAAPGDYGVSRLREVLRSKTTGNFVILAGTPSEESPATKILREMKVPLPQGPEALVIRRTTYDGKPAVVLCGSDSRGLMYAALDTAERVSWSTDPNTPFQYVKDTEEQPYVRERM